MENEYSCDSLRLAGRPDRPGNPYRGTDDPRADMTLLWSTATMGYTGFVALAGRFVSAAAHCRALPGGSVSG